MSGRQQLPRSYSCTACTSWSCVRATHTTRAGPPSARGADGAAACRCHDSAAASSASVLPVPVGDSMSAVTAPWSAPSAPSIAWSCERYGGRPRGMCSATPRRASLSIVSALAASKSITGGGSAVVPSRNRALRSRRSRRLFSAAAAPPPPRPRFAGGGFASGGGFGSGASSTTAAGATGASAAARGEISSDVAVGAGTAGAERDDVVTKSSSSLEYASCIAAVNVLHLLQIFLCACRPRAGQAAGVLRPERALPFGSARARSFRFGRGLASNSGRRPRRHPTVAWRWPCAEAT